MRPTAAGAAEGWSLALKQIAGDAAARQTIALIAAMAEREPVEIGCYCNVPTCHRFALERLIREAAET